MTPPPRLPELPEQTDPRIKIQRVEEKVRRGDRVDLAIIVSILGLIGAFAGWVINEARGYGARGVTAAAEVDHKHDVRSTAIEGQVIELRKDSNERQRRVEEKVDAVDTSVRQVLKEVRRQGKDK